MAKRTSSGIKTIKSDVMLTTLTFVVRSDCTGSIVNCSDMKATVSGTSPGVLTFTFDEDYGLLEGICEPALITPNDANAHPRFVFGIKTVSASTLSLRMLSGSVLGTGNPVPVNPPTSAAITGSMIIAYRDTTRTK